MEIFSREVLRPFYVNSDLIEQLTQKGVTLNDVKNLKEIYM